MENTLIRTEPCPQCGQQMLWTQNAWPPGGQTTNTAYRCLNGHTIDPALTKQCPSCGLHDTKLVAGAAEERGQFSCMRCGETFIVPR
jgi:predicted RNA-binding Zn-ribbon protein involved in translation (DUF1610 family)